MGTASTDSVDYPDYAKKVGEAVSHGDYEQGLLVCGSGTGMAIAANKIKGVRAAVAWNEDIARLAREHNDANVLALPARFMSDEEAVEGPQGMVRSRLRGRPSCQAGGENIGT